MEIKRILMKFCKYPSPLKEREAAYLHKNTNMRPPGKFGITSNSKGINNYPIKQIFHFIISKQ